MNTRDGISFLLACGLHLILFAFLMISFERTISPVFENKTEDKKIIEAVVVNVKSLEAEKAKLEAIEAKKKAETLAREKEREKEIALKREQLQQEEAAMAQLKKKNEELKDALQKEAEKQAAQQKKLEAERVAQLKQAELAKQKAKRAAEEKARQEAAAQMVAEQKAAAAQRQKQDELSRYAMLMRNKIHQHWRQPIGLEIVGFTCKIAVRLLPTGEVLDASVIQSSGNVEFDRSTELAIRKASPLPMSNDPDIAKEFQQFTFTFRPEAA